MNNTYAKIWGLAKDERGNPDFGYLKINLSNMKRESIAGLLCNIFPVEMIQIISKAEFDEESDDDER